MAYEAKVFRVLIASPSDVDEEREIAVKTIQEWNDLNSPERRIVMLPLRWETHSAPEYGTRPQEIINRQIVDHCDILIGIFWTRIGSPTGVSDSGTLEEIERVAGQGRTVMLYFSQIKKDPNSIEIEQLQKLREFKEKTFPKALIESFSSQIEFRDKLAKQIEIQLRTLIATEKHTTSNLTGDISSAISLEFCDSKTGETLGQTISLEATNIISHGIDAIPDYGKVEHDSSENDSWSLSSFMNRDNKNYYREYVEFLVKSALLRPVSFSLKNNGLIGARDIFIDMKISSDIHDIQIGTNVDFNINPPQTHSGMGGLSFYDNIQMNTGDESFAVESVTDQWNATFETRALQPQRTVRSKHRMVIGATTSGTIEIEAKIYADILPKPITQRLKILMEIKQANVTAIELLEKNGISPIDTKIPNSNKTRSKISSRGYSRIVTHPKK
ncbi:hypothetical protein ACFOLG_04450 [Vogesella facilis]|uniref:DUF4062 domain-containing protein n=1 Tax=Vogesella facilis TaxID=1655232 RepID=A0ABV7RDF3_9NEIS